jgi:hypothetical protein
MTDDDARHLIAMWRDRAAYFRRHMATISRGKCHDGERALNRGLGAMADLCADELQQRIDDGTDTARTQAR